MNIGEELVSAYLQQKLKCEFVQQNLYTVEVQGEIDVVGISLVGPKIYVGEVAMHLSTGANAMTDVGEAANPHFCTKCGSKLPNARHWTEKWEALGILVTLILAVLFAGWLSVVIVIDWAARLSQFFTCP